MHHDLWVIRDKFVADSWLKLKSIVSLTERYNVQLKPMSLGHLSIVPLYSWYDYSFGSPNEELKAIWMDYKACKWPGEESAKSITENFMDRNKDHLKIDNQFIISFSHFLPRIDLMPSFIPTHHRHVYPVLGSAALDTQIRELGSNIHVYGHSHVNRNQTIDGVQYINNAFGYPRETHIAAKELICIYNAVSVS